MNVNVLVGLKCPKCKSEGPYTILSTCWAKVSDDGIEETVEHEWTGTSACICLSCKYQGKVKDFEPKKKPGSGNKGGNPKPKDRRTPDAKRRSKAWAKKANE